MVVNEKKILIIRLRVHILFNMNKQRMELSSDRRIENYLESIFTQCNITFMKDSEKGKTAYSFFADKDAKDSLITGVLVNFYKMKELISALGEKDERAFDALLGALIGFGQEEDKEKIEKALRKADVVNLDGFYNFLLDEVREDWNNLALLSSKLYAQCETEEDVYALSIFMLGMDDTINAVMIMDSAQRLFWEKSGTGIEIVPYYGDKERDTIITILSHRPSDVVVKDPSVVPESVLSVIKSLGE